MFTPDSDFIMEVTVDGRAFGQQYINKWFYKFENAGTGPTGGSSTTFLSNWITRYRAEILPEMYVGYSVYRYWLRTITDAVQIAAGPPSTWKPTYSRTLFDYRDGDSAEDVGDKALAEDTAYLPAANTARVIKTPVDKTMGFFKGNYNRFGPFTSAELDEDAADHDRWTSGFIGAFGSATTDLIATPVFDQVGGNGWEHVVFSVVFFGRFLKPGGQPIWQAAKESVAATVRPYVGTQITRRYLPAGGYRGA